jgi:hypothetical protein
MVSIVEPRERYRDKAIECTSAADHTHDAGERVKLLAIAKLFMSLAEHVASRLERGAQHLPDDQPSQSSEA